MFFRQFLLFVLLSLCAYAHASHIVGGEITYVRTTGYTYRVTLSLYVDCINGQPGAIQEDEFANIAVFGADSGNLWQSLSKAVKRNPPERITKLNYNCIKNAPNACVDFYRYETDFYLPPLKGGYIIAFQRCCRNNTLNNIINPASTGATFWTKVEDVAVVQNDHSPVFNNLPPNFLCTNAPLIFDHSAADADGDSLVYELFEPYIGANTFQPRPSVTQFSTPPFQTVIWQSGYSLPYMMNGSPGLKIDRKTGLLTVTPTLSGQFVVGIKVKEYRKGKLIGETKRDYQFNVSECIFDIVSSYAAPKFNCSKTVTFTNNSSSGASYHWDFGVSGRSDDTSSKFEVSYYYPVAGTYTVKLIANKNGCSDTFASSVEVNDSLSPVFNSDTIYCGPFSRELGIACQKCRYKWNTGDSSATITVTEGGIYTIEITRGYCKMNDTIEIKASDIELFKSVNIFTPGRDGINDYFPMQGALPNISMDVYDRWGLLLYRSDYGQQGWDGSVKGKTVPDGIYYYIIHFRDCTRNGEAETHGVVHVISEK